MSERRAVLCAHCLVTPVATVEGEWVGSDLEIFGPMVCEACARCFAETGARCQELLEAVFDRGSVASGEENT